MTDFQLIAVVLALAAAFAYVNARTLRLPSSIGLMAIALVASVAVLLLARIGVFDFTGRARELVEQLDFGNTVLHGMLGLLLFAGALHIDLGDLGREKLAIGALAVGGTLVSTALVGGATYVVLAALGRAIPLTDALLFGALIAPTDPIAVLGMLKSARAPKRLEVRIAGESLFNDGVGVVIFTALLHVASGGTASPSAAAALFAREVVGGAAFGAITGYLTLRLLRSIDDYTVEVLLTLALVVAGYTVAESIGISAPIGAVVAGLVIGNKGPRVMSAESRKHVALFWHLIDEILNAVLFLMIGLALVLVPVTWYVVGVAALAVPVVLLSRLVAVGGVMFALPALRRDVPHSVAILTWGGLRGGLSIAMALAVPVTASHDLVLVMTYAVVAFSILIQGLSFTSLLRRLGLYDRPA